VTFLALACAEEGGACGVLEDLTDTFARLGRALKVVLGPNLLRYGHALKKDVLYWYEAGMKRGRNEK